jgi:hypothetical protein
VGTQTLVKDGAPWNRESVQPLARPTPLLIDVNSLLQSQELVEEINEQVELSLNMSRRIPKQRDLNGVGFFLVKFEQFLWRFLWNFSHKLCHFYFFLDCSLKSHTT